MKFLLLFLVLCFVGCGGGKVVTPPDGMEQAVRDYYAGQQGSIKYDLRGITVRSYPNEVYLVSADFSFTSSSNQQNRGSHQLIVEKAYTEGKTYWQVSKANPVKLKTYGIQ